jgi:ornithine carbamoyltransferase
MTLKEDFFQVLPNNVTSSESDNRNGKATQKHHFRVADVLSTDVWGHFVTEKNKNKRQKNFLQHTQGTYLI